MDTQASLDQVHLLATQWVPSVWAITSDFLVIIVIFATFFFIGWRGGRSFLVSFILSLYVGYALYSVFPYASWLPSTPPISALLSSLGLFAAFCLVGYLILSRMIISDFVSIGLLGLLVLAALATGFLIVLSYDVFPVGLVYTLNPAIDAVFAPQQYFFWWFSAPLIGLFLFAR